MLGSVLLLIFSASSRQQPGVAATFPQVASIEVCGNPALPLTVQSALECAIRTQVKGVANVNLSFSSPSCQPLFGNQAATYSVRVMATAPNTNEGAGDVVVTVRNKGAQIGKETLLWFCN